MKFNLFSLFGSSKEKPEDEQASAAEDRDDSLDTSPGAVLPLRAALRGISAKECTLDRLKCRPGEGGAG